MATIEVETKQRTKLTLLASDIRGIESQGDGCCIQWVIGDVLAKVECVTGYDSAVSAWRMGVKS